MSSLLEIPEVDIEEVSSNTTLKADPTVPVTKTVQDDAPEMPEDDDTEVVPTPKKDTSSKKDTSPAKKLVSEVISKKEEKVTEAAKETETSSTETKCAPKKLDSTISSSEKEVGASATAVAEDTKVVIPSEKEEVKYVSTRDEWADSILEDFNFLEGLTKANKKVPIPDYVSKLLPTITRNSLADKSFSDMSEVKKSLCIGLVKFLSSFSKFLESKFPMESTETKKNYDFAFYIKKSKTMMDLANTKAAEFKNFGISTEDLVKAYNLIFNGLKSLDVVAIAFDKLLNKYNLQDFSLEEEEELFKDLETLKKGIEYAYNLFSIQMKSSCRSFLMMTKEPSEISLTENLQLEAIFHPFTLACKDKSILMINTTRVFTSGVILLDISQEFGVTASAIKKEGMKWIVVAV